MNNSVKVILTAVGIAVLASPVMAQTRSNSHVPASISNAHGSVSQSRASRTSAVAEGNHIRVDDCVRTTFPQCGGN